jgi:biotin synthase
MKKHFEPVQWLKERSPQKLDSLFHEADRVRKLRCGNAVHLRGIVEFSNHCRRDCLYCGLRRSNRSLRRYRLTPAEILESAQIARDTGIPSVVLQSGEDPGFGPREAAWVVSRIKRMGLAVTLSMGELPVDGYRRLRDAGADRYLLKFETSDEGLYARLRPGCALRDRLACLAELKKAGYQVGSGTMIGLPGQSVASIAADIALFRELDLDMIGIGPFIPHPATPLAAAGVCCLEMVLKAVALT